MIETIRKKGLAILMTVDLLFSVMPSLTIPVFAAGTMLNAGDIVILEFNGNGTDGFSFMPLVDLAGGTAINFTDYGWNGTSFNTGEEAGSSIGNMITYTAPAGGITAGTVIRQDKLNVGGTAFTACSEWAYNYNNCNYINSFIATIVGHDGIIAFQGSPSSPTFLWALQTGSWGGTDDYWNSALPTGLTNGVNAICFADVGEPSATVEYTVDDGVYIGPTTAADAQTWRTRVANSANWNAILTGTPPILLYPNYYTVISSDTTAPTVTDTKISISGATGTGSVYKIGDIVTATWNNTASGDNNTDIATVTVDFSQFGGGSAVTATNSSGTWTATYTITSGAIDGTNRNISVTATDNAGNTTTTADTANATVDNTAPIVTDANISINGATGTAGAYVVGDTVTATWNNTAGGDNNTDIITVKADFSQLGGGSAVIATNSSGTWKATDTITSGSIEGTNKNISVAATDNAGNTTTTADTTNAKVDNQLPSLTDGGVSRSGDTSGTVNFTSSEVGNYYYKIVADGAGEPAINTDESGTSCTTEETTITNPTGLTAVPSITSQPVNQNVNEGDNVSFTVDATGTGLTYQWQVDTGSGFSNISNGGVYSGATTATLNITGATAGMSGNKYKVVVSGSSAPAATSDTATLTVNTATTYAVTVNHGTGDGNYAENADVTITADASESGKQFKNWTVVSGGVSLASSTSETTTFTMPANEVEVTATYEYIGAPPTISHSITAVVSPTNGGSVSGTGQVPDGESTTLKATANSGYQFLKWTKDGNTVGTSSTLSLTNVVEDAEYTAFFKKSSNSDSKEEPKQESTDREVTTPQIPSALPYRTTQGTFTGEQNADTLLQIFF